MHKTLKLCNKKSGYFALSYDHSNILGDKIGDEKFKLLISLRNYGSGGWDRTNDHSVIPAHKVSQSDIFIRV